MPDSSADSYINENPTQAMNYEDFYMDYMRSRHPNWKDSDIPQYGSASYKIAKVFSRDQSNAESRYQTYLDNLSLENEYKATQSARAYDEYLSNTQYQRAMKDMEKAGLNPYMLVNSGSVSPASVTTSAKASYNKFNSDYLKKQKDGRNVALTLLAVARLVAALL